MRAKGGLRKAGSVVPVSDSVCYCDGARDVGSMELFCSGCSKWFHRDCLKDLKEVFSFGVSFMVCYVFNCQDCSPTKVETWQAKTANLVHMTVTVMSTLTYRRMKELGADVSKPSSENLFFSLHDEVIPYFDENWDYLTSMPRRVKNTWHATLLKTLSNETNLFIVDTTGSPRIALAETNLAEIGPNNELVRQIGKRTPSDKSNLATTLVTAAPVEKPKAEPDVNNPADGPKTRGASKRRNADSGATIGKKPKLASDSVTVKFSDVDGTVDFPFNKEGYRYYLVEKDPHVPEKEQAEEIDSVLVIPPQTYRIKVPPRCTISPNDRAYQLKVMDDQLTVSGYEGYCVAKANTSVTKGTWYYEVHFLKQPPGSHVRIGWSQGLAVNQACVGYNKFSYGWRSLHGTKFHDAHGKKYKAGGFREGDVLGCLIHLPFNSTNPGSSHDYLPNAHKDLPLINFRHHYFYEGHDEPAEGLKVLKPLKGSRIEFFLNGVSCGVAYEDIYGGTYFPAISIFHEATIKCNFGPKMMRIPRGAQPMSARIDQLSVEQSLADVVSLVENDFV